MMARGLYLLHARYGNQPFETMVTAAEQLARGGVPVSRALAKDLALVSGPLLADPNARVVFSQTAFHCPRASFCSNPISASTLGPDPRRRRR